MPLNKETNAKQSNSILSHIISAYIYIYIYIYIYLFLKYPVSV